MFSSVYKQRNRISSSKFTTIVLLETPTHTPTQPDTNRHVPCFMPALKSCVLLAIAIGRKTNSWLLLYTFHRYSRYANKLLALSMSGIRLGYEAVLDHYKIATTALCKWQEVKLPALKWSIDWESHNLKCVSSLYKPTTPADQKIINLRTYNTWRCFTPFRIIFWTLRITWHH